VSQQFHRPVVPHDKSRSGKCHQPADRPSKNEASDVLEELLEIIKATLESGEELKVSGFGKFEVKEKNERRGRNPQTGTDITIKSRKVVTFKPSEMFKGRMNGAE
jgi:integration host factor subunit alpha